MAVAVGLTPMAVAAGAAQAAPAPAVTAAAAVTSGTWTWGNGAAVKVTKVNGNSATPMKASDYSKSYASSSQSFGLNGVLADGRGVWTEYSDPTRMEYTGGYTNITPSLEDFNELPTSLLIQRNTVWGIDGTKDATFYRYNSATVAPTKALSLPGDSRGEVTYGANNRVYWTDYSGSKPRVMSRAFNGLDKPRVESTNASHPQAVTGGVVVVTHDAAGKASGLKMLGGAQLLTVKGATANWASTFAASGNTATVANAAGDGQLVFDLAGKKAWNVTSPAGAAAKASVTNGRAAWTTASGTTFGKVAYVFDTATAKLRSVTAGDLGVTSVYVNGSAIAFSGTKSSFDGRPSSQTVMGVLK